VRLNRIKPFQNGSDIMTNPVLESIKNRRSILRFDSSPIEQEKLEAILEAGRWAPSWLNRQPWNFIVVTDQKIKEQLSEVVPTVFVQGLKEAPICIVVTVDTTVDPYHFLEDGAAATQNMALAAYSLGLHSCWIGVFDIKNEKKSSEAHIKQILSIPETHRVISILPIGKLGLEAPKKDRKPLFQMLHKNKFGKQ
jgi:nitroreductase